MIKRAQVRFPASANLKKNQNFTFFPAKEVDFDQFIVNMQKAFFLKKGL